MSKPQVTITSLIQKWSEMADYHYAVRKSEMEAFFEEAKENSITGSEIIKYKDKIVGLWCPLSWADAKKKYEHWKDRKMWEGLKEHVTKEFRELFAENFPPDKKPADEPLPQKEVPTFTNIEDFRAWKAKRTGTV